MSLLLLLAATAAVVSASPSSSSSLSSVPSSAWAALNKTVSGRLGVGIPLARSCFKKVASNVHGGTFDANDCAAVEANIDNITFVASRFGGYLSFNGGACLATGKACLLDGANSSDPDALAKTCDLGVVPPYYVDVKEVSDIQAALKFGKDHHVPLVVKNSGHDYKGRSSAPNSLAIWTHHITPDLVRNKSFVPAGCEADGKTYDAITYGAGAGMTTLYDYAERNNVTFIGGSHPTVGAGGGWLTGGGHSLLSAKYGLGVDRALEIEVVTPDGELRTASRCRNAKLFWALRGGGGNAFGVVWRVTAELAPQVKIQVALATFASNATTLKAFLDIVTENSLRWNAEGWGGAVVMPSTLTADATFLFVNPVFNSSAANASVKPVFDYVNSLGNSSKGTVVIEYPSWYPVWSTYIASIPDLGHQTILSSRFIENKNLHSKDKRKQVVDALIKSTHVAGTDKVLPETDTFLGRSLLLFYDFPTAPIVEPPPSAVSPLWRSSSFFAMFTSALNYDAPPSQHHAEQQRIHAATDVLRAITPGGGAYINEAQVDEPDYQTSFWGQTKYDKLLKYKREIDPQNLLTCWQCIGFDAHDPRYGCYTHA